MESIGPSAVEVVLDGLRCSLHDQVVRAQGEAHGRVVGDGVERMQVRQVRGRDPRAGEEDRREHRNACEIGPIGR